MNSALISPDRNQLARKERGQRGVGEPTNLPTNGAQFPTHVTCHVPTHVGGHVSTCCLGFHNLSLS